MDLETAVCEIQELETAVCEIQRALDSLGSLTLLIWRALGAFRADARFVNIIIHMLLACPV